ncbi:hypothetical protein AVEN_57086-1 [Araneus ventricosus]|uniref:Endonuclease/exonuclease/phosphatase domain-containing protein n=1 Tax=Araneus ventricosus TaxID=182803 RepID=A0A4Y2VPS5_ARAVE|nr:hypothetical protein AVEN_57086-1 [Araneus ventricosus]
MRRKVPSTSESTRPMRVRFGLHHDSCYFSASLVQETFLPPGFTPLIANYQVYRNDSININRRTHNFGGTCIYIKSTIEHHRVPTPELESMDATIVEIKIGSHPPIKIISAYARASMTGGFPLVDLQKLLKSGPNIIIVGDLNAAHIAWNSPRTSFYGRKLFNYLQGINGINVLAPRSPTHINLHTWDTVIDPNYASVQLRIAVPPDGQYSSITIDLANGEFLYPCRVNSSTGSARSHNPVLLNFTSDLNPSINGKNQRQTRSIQNL